ncbi:hypothetical protein H5410_003182 [Solanum commersonii]|uniref:Uncharacterized protein n=1 Tax=Solanum commersonii TaxID=4109 RepID=A0A9J6B434_SOLCO|nr:hypothetical protein H5410_003182 [Solanum commersonii]
MNTQLSVAEQLSKNLLKLVTDLSIHYPAKGQNVRKELFETICLSYDGASYKSPVREKVVNTPFNKAVSVFLDVKERSRRKQTSPVKSSEPETARRCRDSLDRKHHQSKTRERPVTAQLNIFNASSTSSQQVRGKGLHDLPEKQSTENPFFQWADGLSRHATDTPPMSSPVSLLQHESQLTAVTSQYSLVDTPNLATTRSGRSIISLKDIVQIGGPKAIQPGAAGKACKKSFGKLGAPFLVN